MGLQGEDMELVAKRQVQNRREVDTRRPVTPLRKGENLVKTYPRRRITHNGPAPLCGPRSTE